ncbi:hypothetical protein LCGC14_1337660 [marine sediment metagenome]|uniref:Uncharacterized protein n=1 Tax=marine sediment metagenome TaxID=412755 RepID=A0A0F9NGX8_9ZZZZ
MTALDKLRKLDDAARDDSDFDVMNRAEGELNMLSHLLRPAMEFVMSTPCDDKHDWPECKLSACNQSICTRCCLLNTLEEALK